MSKHRELGVLQGSRGSGFPFFHRAQSWASLREEKIFHMAPIDFVGARFVLGMKITMGRPFSATAFFFRCSLLQPCSWRLVFVRVRGLQLPEH